MAPGPLRSHGREVNGRERERAGEEEDEEGVGSGGVGGECKGERQRKRGAAGLLCRCHSVIEFQRHTNKGSAER